ncbi:MAG: hypothetical protein M0D55_02405 [Elusimicrobiota bacterium]|nr:MAG: hypothetical protein M0D55_02405 [Elusimicrobiota bacterium]
MKTILAALLLLIAGAARADSFNDFQNSARPGNLKPFALDLGGILGGASAHTGRAIGMPGFWAGVVGSVQSRPDRDDMILRNSGAQAFGLPMIEVGVGLPFKVDVIARGVALEGLTVLGGGLRYGLYRTDVVDTFLPNISISALGEKVDHKYFTAAHGALNAAATWNLPLIKPYFVVGYDVTEVKAGSGVFPGVVGAKATARGSRFAAGADVHPLPFISVRGGYSIRHGIPGFDLGLGVQF